MSSKRTKFALRSLRYLLVAVIALIVLIPAWTIFVMLEIQPESLMSERSLVSQLLWWVLGPVVVVVGLLAWRWHVGSNRVLDTAVQTAPAAVQQKPPSTAPEAREYSLEIISLGVTFDKYHQSELWDALKQGHPQASIREQDPKKYPWSGLDKGGVEGGRGYDTAENGASYTPQYWAAPGFHADGPSNPADPPTPIDPAPGMLGDAETNGMPFHLFVTGDWELSERPDVLLQRVFDFFDRNPDVPYVLLSAADGLFFRDLFLPPGAPKLIRDGYYIPSMPDSSALFVLARRERVDAIRPFVWEDPNNQFSQRTMRDAYWGLAETVPVPSPRPGHTRHPTVAEWLAFTPEFVERDDVYPRGTTFFLDRFSSPAHRPPRNFKPTPWFPVPWTKEQLRTFDALPTLGFLHRPIFVKTVDEHGQPLKRRDARAAALAAGWQEALQTLPESERKSAPARLISATGGNVEQTIALTSVMSQWTAQGGPQLDPSKPTQWINTDARLGNTGAATFFMQMAIGVMGAQREGGVSAAINLRDPSEASIVMISPPPEEKRLTQQHATGGDVFKNKLTPFIDPNNYKN